MTNTTAEAPAPLITYMHRVEVDGPSKTRKRYDGPDAADAVAAWSQAIEEGAEYVTLESLRDLPKELPHD